MPIHQTREGSVGVKGGGCAGSESNNLSVPFKAFSLLEKSSFESGGLPVQRPRDSGFVSGTKRPGKLAILLAFT